MAQALRKGEEVSFKIAMPPFEKTGIYLGKNPENKAEGLIALENGEGEVSVLRADIIKHKFPNIKRLNDPDEDLVFEPIDKDEVVEPGTRAPDFLEPEITLGVEEKGGKIIGAKETDNGSERPTLLHGHGWQKNATIEAARLMCKAPDQEHPHVIVITSCRVPKGEAEKIADISGRTVYFPGRTNTVSYAPLSLGIKYVEFTLPRAQHWNRVSPKGNRNENPFSKGPTAITIDLGETGRTSSLPRTGKSRKL